MKIKTLGSHLNTEHISMYHESLTTVSEQKNYDLFKWYINIKLCMIEGCSFKTKEFRFFFDY